MRTLRRFCKRLGSWTTTLQDEERLRAEIDEHLALQTADNVRAGLSPAEARRQAALKFGAVEAIRESYRDQRGLPFLETLIQDTRQALRCLRMAPAFTIATVLTLALGIGATTSIFTLVHAILLKPFPIISIRTLREQATSQFTQQRLIARLTSFFGVLSLVLASVGLYGVTAYSAGRCVSEIGVRMALGADRGHIVRLVLRGAFGLILLGLVIGLPLTLAAGRFLGNQLYGMNPYHPAVIVAAVLALGFSALVACLIPAFRASLISPLEALRAE